MYLVPLSPLHLEELPFQVHLGILSEQNLESAHAGMVLICPSTDQNWSKQFGTNTQFLPGGLFTDTFVTDCSLIGTVWWDLQRGVRTTLLFRFVFLQTSLRQFDNCVYFRLSFALFVCLFNFLFHVSQWHTWDPQFCLAKALFGWADFPCVWLVKSPGVGSISMFGRERDKGS